jgi:SAM-dependent methyltransferase
LANNAQVERVREDAPRADHYAPLAHRFHVDPRRRGDAVLDALLELASPGETWLDIGSGPGRYALPLALKVGRVVALDPSPGMLDGLRQAMVDHGIVNVEPVDARWPSTAHPPGAFGADVALISHVGYDIAEIGPFLDAMDRAASRRVAVLGWQRPTYHADSLWPAVHGEEREPLPALPEFVMLLLARGRRFGLRRVSIPPITYDSIERALTFGRIQTWVAPGGDKDARLKADLARRLIERDGKLAFDWTPLEVGVVAW